MKLAPLHFNSTEEIVSFVKQLADENIIQLENGKLSSQSQSVLAELLIVDTDGNTYLKTDIEKLTEEEATSYNITFSVNKTLSETNKKNQQMAPENEKGKEKIEENQEEKEEGEGSSENTLSMNLSQLQQEIIKKSTPHLLHNHPLALVLSKMNFDDPSKSEFEFFKNTQNAFPVIMPHISVDGKDTYAQHYVYHLLLGDEKLLKNSLPNIALQEVLYANYQFIKKQKLNQDLVKEWKEGLAIAINSYQSLVKVKKFQFHSDLMDLTQNALTDEEFLKQFSHFLEKTNPELESELEKISSSFIFRMWSFWTFKKDTKENVSKIMGMAAVSIMVTSVIILALLPVFISLSISGGLTLLILGLAMIGVMACMFALTQYVIPKIAAPKLSEKQNLERIINLKTLNGETLTDRLEAKSTLESSLERLIKIKEETNEDLPKEQTVEAATQTSCFGFLNNWFQKTSSSPAVTLDPAHQPLLEM